ncbi:nuclear transport factor 2 family protein [Streptomyces apocyni]|uniref:nuclear transport factor 2 family protein n=1 Tax=Streptomyces apocyni TaxID=2654677 RepID=UPI001E3A0C07|nr:nuclear transport factor 2 family protein [Streptomyces apocyni]
MTQAVQATYKQVTGDLYAEVQTFYAWQMRRVDALDIEGFAQTFTEDGEVVHAGGQRQRGRAEMVAGMRAALPRYQDIAVRHWFDHLLIEPDADDPDTLYTSYYTLVTQTDREGKVSFQPTFTVADVLIRQDGRLITRSRVITKDTPVAPPAPELSF